MKSVSHIFGGEAKVKVMRLFIFNPSLILNPQEVVRRIKESPKATKKELKTLVKAGLIKKRAKGFTLNSSYPYLRATENFLVDATPLTHQEIIKRLSRAGNLKLVLVSGVFLHDKDSRVDLLVVGTNLKKAKVISAISSIEAEIGRELRYALFETADFQYRLGIYDKLVRDILDYAHEKILNKLAI
ncbi:MAG: hypothetical protein WBL19_01370 [Minisyncoccia bacterium]